MVRSERRRGDVRVSLFVSAALLLLTDLLLGAWRPGGLRLPSHFSGDYLRSYALEHAAGPGLVVLGDSEMWGYGVAAAASPVAQLERTLGRPVDNLTYEAETPINEDFVLRLLLAHGIRPRAVIVEINSASFNETAVEYDRLNAALAEVALPALLEPFDAGRLDDAQRTHVPTPGERLDRFVAAHWRLYGRRVDLHQALFGDADLAGALFARVHPLLQPNDATGSGRYAAMYDLTPLDRDNVDFAYAGHLFAMLAKHRIPGIVLLPPVNHALLHRYVDNAAYDANRRRVARLAQASGLAVLDLDRLLPSQDFIDNTHLNAAGGDRLARAIAPHVAPYLDVLQ
ncbi:MAG TPA: hypothetical protein VFB22_13100 [Candidatus Baltobacteraceae bacterium]|nr:hypothetical protein [Candidatus Baltobacteraceae bacterium]